MKKLSTLFLLLMAFQVSSLAQIAKLKSDDLATLKSRQLIVVLREPDPDKLKDYQKESRKLTAYKKEIALYNDRIQKVAPRIWQFNGAVLFKPLSEVTALQKDKNKEYAIAEFHLQKVKERPNLTVHTDPFKDEVVVPTLSISLIEKPSNSLGDYQFMDRTPTEGELAVGLMQLQAAYRNLESGHTLPELQQQHTETLKSKVLLLDQAQFKAWISDQEMKNIYPYPYEKVDRATIEKHILEQNPKYTILSIAPIVGMPRLMHSVVDLQTGNTLSSVVPGAEGTGINTRDSTVITKESLMGYATGIGQ